MYFSAWEVKNPVVIINVIPSWFLSWYQYYLSHKSFYWLMKLFRVHNILQRISQWRRHNSPAIPWTCNWRMNIHPHFSPAQTMCFSPGPHYLSYGSKSDFFGHGMLKINIIHYTKLFEGICSCIFLVVLLNCWFHSLVRVKGCPF